MVGQRAPGLPTIHIWRALPWRASLGVIYTIKANSVFPFVNAIEPLAHNMFTSGLYSALATVEIQLILCSFFSLHIVHTKEVVQNSEVMGNGKQCVNLKSVVNFMQI